MSQQGGTSARHEDDWWGQLYDDSTEDTGPTAAPDSLDDRFASAKRTVTGRGRGERGPARPAPAQDPPREPAVPPQRTSTPPDTPTPPPAPSQPPQPPSPKPAATPTRPEPTAATPTRPEPTAAPESQAPSEPLAAPESRIPAESQTPPRRTAAPESQVPAESQAPPEQPAAPAPPASPGLTKPPAEPEPPEPHKAPELSEAPAEPGPPAATILDPALQPGPPALTLDPAPPATLASAPPTSHPDRPEPPARVTEPVLPPALTAPPPSSVDYVGSGPPTYDAEPTALPAADPDELGALVADTVLDGARYGACTVRAVSLRGDSARYRGEPRRDALLTARFGSGEHALVLVAMATGARATPGAHRAAADACRLIGRAVGRSHQRLGEDIRAARRGELKSGLHRLTDRSLGKLRASAVEQGLDPEEYAASLRCLLLPADPSCRTRVFFGVGDGGLFRLRGGEWQDIEPPLPPAAGPGGPAGRTATGFGSAPAETPEGDRLTMDLGIPTPPSPYEPAPAPPRAPFRFRASVARPGDALVMCTGGLSDPLRGEPALCAYLARRWSCPAPPGLAEFLADAQVRVKGYADDRTAAAVWEA
ncbi:protein phosphatase 2C domain-containing protein [Streptomyces sp. L2]|uniref:protein phosphatase 2C domain-containing protein n=1 Tax=Streptomyces sp. L2 TaxID=2162665 RepID=UPI0010102AC1|nr:protein phosphatase 2C domain-containing protein [Streptomyces sp. L2]